MGCEEESKHPGRKELRAGVSLRGGSRDLEHWDGSMLQKFLDPRQTVHHTDHKELPLFSKQSQNEIWGLNRCLRVVLTTDWGKWRQETKESVMNFMYEPDWAKGCPGNTLFLGMSVKVFSDEINIWIGGLIKVHCPPQCEWSRSWILKRAEERQYLLPYWLPTWAGISAFSWPWTRIYTINFPGS